MIRQATVKDLESLLPLYLAYREFYQQEPQIEKARLFLEKNLQENRSVIFIKIEAEKILGFAQLYSAICSLSMKNYWILYDLFVDNSARKKGIASALLKEVDVFASQTKASRVELQTAVTNLAAQRLYEAEGYQCTGKYRTYQKEFER